MAQRRAEVDSVFRHSLGAIHFALVDLYLLSEAGAAEVAGNLYVWFERFAERGSRREMPVSTLRFPLLLAACQAGVAAKQRELRGGSCVEAGLRETLARAPEDVARELALKLPLGNDM